MQTMPESHQTLLVSTPKTQSFTSNQTEITHSFLNSSSCHQSNHLNQSNWLDKYNFTWHVLIERTAKSTFLYLLFEICFLALYPHFLQHQAYATYCQVLRALLVYSLPVSHLTCSIGRLCPTFKGRLSSFVILFENKAIHYMSEQ